MNHPIGPSEARLASVIFAISLFFLVVAVLTAVELRKISADHKAQLNRVIELLEKKP